MSREVEARIAADAAGQHGVITHRQLVEAGLARFAIGRRLRNGRLSVLHRGVYLAAPFRLPHTREMAAVLAGEPDAVLSHCGAAAFLGLRPAADGPVDVSVPGNRGHRPGIRMHRVDPLAADEWTVIDGIPVTTVGRTLVDLAAVVGTRELEGAIARAERAGLIPAEDLARLVTRYRGRRGMRTLSKLVETRTDPTFTRSAAEERLLELVRAAGLPDPECNVAFGRYEIDFLWRPARVAVEVEGFRYHASRPRFEGDRRKDAELVAGGLSVIRLSWRRITNEPLAVAAQLGQALGRALARR